ncbi:MAG: tetratricopeptide repeat protein [Hyphomicrobiales bacterium]
MFSLGSLYSRGLGVAKDESQAVDWYRKAADKGQASAMFNLGKYYYDKKDPKQAARWFEMAAEAGQVEALTALGSMHLHGEGGDPKTHRRPLICTARRRSKATP